MSQKKELSWNSSKLAFGLMLAKNAVKGSPKKKFSDAENALIFFLAKTASATTANNGHSPLRGDNNDCRPTPYMLLFYIGGTIVLTIFECFTVNTMRLKYPFYYGARD